MASGDLLAELIRRQLPGGGWSTLVSSRQAALEPTCHAALALGSQAAPVRERAYRFLLHVQNPNGSWPTFAGDGNSRVRGLIRVAQPAVGVSSAAPFGSARTFFPGDCVKMAR